MTKSVTVNAIFGDKHKDYIAAAEEATISVAEGAVRAGKTIDNIWAFARLLNAGSPDRIHLATGSTAGNAKLNIGDCNGFGLEHIFRGRCRWTKYRDNDALTIRLKGKDYIVIFAGGGKADSYKRIRGNSYGMWIATEINLHHQSMIKEAFNRQLAATERKVFWDLNPSAPGSWIYSDYIDRFPAQFGDRYNYRHFTIRDNATITPERLAEIEAQYIPGSLWYRRDILGERCAAEGLVYEMFDPALNTTPEHGTVGDWYLSMDYGTSNPTAMLLWRLCDGTAYLEYEYYYDGREARHQKTDAEYYADMDALIGEIPIRRILIDPSAASYKAEIHKHHKYHVQDAQNDVINGIRVTAAIMAKGRIKIHTGCRHTLDELGMYMWDASKPEDAVIKEHDHAMDAMRYFCYSMRRRIGIDGR